MRFEQRKLRRLPKSPIITVAMMQQWMMQHGISVAELAESLGVHHQTFRHLFRRSTPDKELKGYIAHALCWTAMRASLPGLPTPRLMSEETGIAIAKGFIALKIKKSERSTADCHAIAYAERLANAVVEGDSASASQNQTPAQSEARTGQEGGTTDRDSIRSGEDPGGQIPAGPD